MSLKTQNRADHMANHQRHATYPETVLEEVWEWRAFAGPTLPISRLLARGLVSSR